MIIFHCFVSLFIFRTLANNVYVLWVINLYSLEFLILLWLITFLFRFFLIQLCTRLIELPEESTFEKSFFEKGNKKKSKPHCGSSKTSYLFESKDETFSHDSGVRILSIKHNFYGCNRATSLVWVINVHILNFKKVLYIVLPK